MNATKTVTMLVVLSLAGITPLGAQQTMGPEIPVSVLDNEQYLPDVAYNSNRDQYLVVWHNFCGGNRDIYGQRLDGDGNLLSSFAIAAGGNDCAQPAVAYDDINDRYLVVWIFDYYGDGSDLDIRGRLIPWNGPDPVMTEFVIDASTSDQFVPEVAFAHTQQEFMVVWNNLGGAPGSISGRRIAADGTLAAPSFIIASGPTDRTNPDIAYNLARNEYLVTYDLAGLDISATRLTAGGTILGGGEFGIAGWPDPESQPAGAACKGGADQYFVVWQSQQSATDNSVFGRFIDGAGVPGAVVQFYNSPIDEQQPDVSCNTRLQEYLVVWEHQYSNTSGPFGVFGQRVTTDGRLSGQFTVRGVVAGDTKDHTSPATAAGLDGGFLVVWEHDRSGTAFQDIHGRIVAAAFFADGFESGNLIAWSSSSP